MTASYDVVVVGGGAAGLSGALSLTRGRRSVLVIDAGQPRNAPADGVHMYLGSEGMAPADLLAKGRAEAEGYGARIVRGEAVTAERTDDGFRVTLADSSTVAARRLLVTTGLVDELPDVPGVAQRWGRDVLHCPYCHGWEVRDQVIGVLGAGPMAVHQALMWRQWSADVILVLHDLKPDADELEQLAARGVTVVEGPVAGLVVTDDRLTGVSVADGRMVGCQALVVAANRLTARSGVLAGLGLHPIDQEFTGHVIGGYIAADPMGATAVPGVWVAGNITNLMDQVISAAAAGVRAGAAINADLIAEETRLAVEAYRNPKTGAEFWDARYAESDRIWSGNPNVILVREASALTPGSALDLGSGEGADAIWLAEIGWRVTAADISQVALDRSAERAAAAGVADRIEWQRHDLGQSFPAGRFDLVTASFLHSYGDFPREAILRSAAAKVAPGGVLLVLGHAAAGPWDHDHHDLHLPTPAELIASLELAEGAWEVLVAEENERLLLGPDGKEVTRLDNVVKLRLRSGPTEV